MGKKIKFTLILTAGLVSMLLSTAQNSAWDNTQNKHWPLNFKTVQIQSSADGQFQNARVFSSTQESPQPLIISLHTWSGDFNQEDPLAQEIVLRNWNYIHPNFRGPNNTPQSCASPIALQDIEDAIDFAIRNMNVDTSEVHMIGVSGGAHATLAAYMKLNRQIKSFNAWVPISDVEAWYWESLGRNLKYSSDIKKITSSDEILNTTEARNRSPLYMDFNKELRKGASLLIYAGVHDGYTGSVPISHSIHFFNKILAQTVPKNKDLIISDSLSLSLITKRMNPDPPESVLGKRKIHLSRQAPGIGLTIFEGRHEMLVPHALSLIPVYGSIRKKKYNILTIGDSNGAAEDGWPQQLSKLLPYSKIINKSLAGNTIGFDNLNRSELNTLKNIDHFIPQMRSSLTEQPDYIIIGLGTNDAKRVFAKRQNEVPENMSLLIEKIKTSFTSANLNIPKIILLSVPPMNKDKFNEEKYQGGNQRLKKINKSFEKLAQKHQIIFLNTFSMLKSQNKDITKDGVHLTKKAQFDIADMIREAVLK